MALLALALRLRLALSAGPNFDESWHVFVGAVHPARQLLEDLQNVAHPPLCILVIRLLRSLYFLGAPGGPLLWCRLLSLLPGIATVVLCYCCARRMDVSRAVACLGALLFAIASSAIAISSCVRGYSLATLFLMAAYAAYLEILPAPEDAPAGAWRRFLLCASLASWTEYCAGFAVAALCANLALLALPRRAYLRSLLRAAGRCRAALGAFAAATLALAVYLRWTVAPSSSGHVGLFLRGDRSLGRFFLDGFASNISAFTPLSLSGDGRALLWLAASLVGLAWVAWRHLAAGRRDLRKGTLPLILLLLWMTIFALALAGLYPYGGYARHQFILFPFLALLAVVVLETAYQACPGPRSRVALCLLSALAMVRGTGVLSDRPLDIEVVPGWPYAEESRALRRAMAPGDAIYLSSFNMYMFYSNVLEHRFEARGGCGEACTVFSVSRGDERFGAVRESWRWIIPPQVDPSLLGRLRELMTSQGLAGLWVLSLRWPSGQGGPPWESDDGALGAGCARQGLRLTHHLRFKDGEAWRVALQQ